MEEDDHRVMFSINNEVVDIFREIRIETIHGSYWNVKRSNDLILTIFTLILTL